MENVALLDDFFARRAERFEWVRPRAWLIGFPRMLGSGSIDDLTEALVRDTGVMLVPGSMFDHPGNHFRIGFGRRTMPEALARFEAFLDR